MVRAGFALCCCADSLLRRFLEIVLSLVDLVHQIYVRLRVLKARLGNCPEVSANSCVGIVEMVAGNLVWVSLVFPGCCCPLDMSLCWDLGLVFCYSLGSQSRLLWQMPFV